MSVRTCAFAVIILLALSLPTVFAQAVGPVLPGESVDVDVTCTNIGNVPEYFEARNTQSAGLTVVPISQDVGLVEPYQGGRVKFKVTVPPGTAPGTYTLQFQCLGGRGTVLSSKYVSENIPIDVQVGQPGCMTICIPGIPKCIIATATYGSELSPEVQLLRNFRDRDILRTFAGSEFMKVFNPFYYSFSPQVASVISENNGLKAVMRYVLYPLIGILWASQQMYDALALNPEAAVVVAGLFAGSMIGLVYALPFTSCACLLARRVTGRRLTRRHAAMLVAVLDVALGLIVVSELTGLALLMQFSTSVVVLAAVALPGIAFSAWAIGTWSHRKVEL